MIGDKVQGYTIIESTVIGNVKFVVGENPNNSIAPYVTWQANMKNEPYSYFWGHYYGDKNTAMADYGDRISREAQYLKSFQEKKAKESTGQLIVIKRGESGYYPSDWSTDDAVENRNISDSHNGKRGITKAQEEAMLAGSMHGWEVPAAKPQVQEQIQKKREELEH